MTASARPDLIGPVLVGMGANLPGKFGTPHNALLAALNAMENRGLQIAARSNLYLSAPVPMSDQPWYHNAVVALAGPPSPFAVLEILQDVENDLGRVRTVRNAPRIIDLDLIAYGDTVLDKPELIVPHPRAHLRAFVLHPLRDVAPGWIHPVSGVTLDDMIAALPPEQVMRMEGAL